MNLHLRKAEIKDMPALIAIEESVAGATTTGIAVSGLDEWTKDIISNTVYLIEKDGTLVGDIQYEKKEADYIRITGLVIDPKFQRQGIGKEALMMVLEELKDVKRIDLTVHPENEKALKLYQSLGFIEESRKEINFSDGEPRIKMILKK